MRRAVHLIVLTVAMTGVVVGGSVLIGADEDRSAGEQQVAMASPEVRSRIQDGDLSASATMLQARLRDRPEDATAWATLGTVYVELARVSRDPTYYPRAQEALERSFEHRRDADGLAEAGSAALAAARHNFDDALALAQAALDIDPFNEQALAVRVDALTELGRYDEALAAAREADAARPSLTTFTRLAYQYELRGDLERARSLLDRAVQSTTSAGSVAFVEFQIGQLVRAQGDLTGAEEAFDAALAADPGYAPARAGLAQLAAIRGDTDSAREQLTQVVAALPAPEYLTSLGELLEVEGRDAEAQEQYDVVRAYSLLAEANGMTLDLESALFEADHGDPAAALEAAEAEWQRRQSIHVADAMAWALHVNGRDAQALEFAEQATALGTRDASMLYHRGVIEYELELYADARAHLTEALAIDPAFSPLRARRATELLADLDAQG